MNQHTPSVSVLIPVYNSGDYLRVCIESLENQDCGTAAEFICVNDGSTDGSPAVLDAWAARDPRVRVIHQRNKGYGKAMNAALDKARGAYIGIVEPDDWAEPHMFSTLLRLAEQTGADIAKGVYVGESDKKSHTDTRFQNRAEGETSAPEDFPVFLTGAPSIWAAIYRKSMLEAHRIRFSETPGASFQDLGFFMRTWAAAETIATTGKPVYHYREDNPNSSTRRKEDGAWAVLREIELAKPVFRALAASPVRRTLLLRRVFHSMLADYKLRVNETLYDWLPACSELLHALCPQQELHREYFTNKEWHDLSVLYSHPQDYPEARKLGASLLQRIFSIRTEGGRRYVRFLGGRYDIGSK